MKYATISLCVLTLGMALSAGQAARPVDHEIALNRVWAEQAFSAQPSDMTAPSRLILVHEDGIGETKVNRAAVGGPIRLGKKTYSRGIGLNSHNVLRVELDRLAARFVSDIGMDRDADGTPASSRFHVSVGGKDLFVSDVMRGNGEVRSIDVPLNGARTFDLIVDVGGGDRTCDHADWADARVILEDGTTVWLDDIVEAGKPGAGLPFSFVYGGRQSSEFIRSWKSQVKDEQPGEGIRRRTLTLTDRETGLEVKAVATIYTDTAGVDWTIYFTNTGDKDTPVLEQVKAVDLPVALSISGDPVLHRLHGTTSCSAFTLDDFQPYDDAVKVGKRFEFGASGAMSSYDVSPYFNVQWDGGGVITAVGWTGHWGASVERATDRLVRLEAGMRTMHLRLHPGETIRTPRILQVHWTGSDELRSYNLFRQTMLKHIMPKMDGVNIFPPIANCTSSFKEAPMTNEKLERAYIDKFKGLGFECYWLDAWWFRPKYPDGIGNWGFPIDRAPDPVRFPSGIRALSDLAHGLGMKFLIWLAVESVSPNTYIAREHPEWLMPVGGNGGTFNLAIPEAREWMTKFLNTAIKEWNIDIWRNDSGPSYDQWKLFDKDPDRVGISEIRYVEGFYRMWDDIRKANPRSYIDNCCGSGTRVDLETCSRSMLLSRTDGVCWTLPVHDRDKAAIQNQAISYGLNRYIPLATQAQMGAEPYYVRSGFNGGLFFWDDMLRDDYPSGQLRQGIVEAKRIRKYLLGDFWPLTKASTSTEDWCAFQYHRPAEDDGIVLAFRRQNSPYTAMTCALRGIDPNAEYTVTTSATYKSSKPRTMKGRDLAHLETRITDCPGSVLIEYARVR